MKLRFSHLLHSLSRLGYRGKILAVTGVFLLAACAGDYNPQYAGDFSQLPKDDKLRQIVDMQNRLDRIAGTMLVGNADLCRNQVRNLLGFSATNKYSYSTTMSMAASQVLSLGERLQVTNVIPGGGAEKAGLARGDTLLTIEGQPVPQGANAESETVSLLAPIVAKNTAVNMSVARNGSRLDLVVPLTRACGFRVELGHSDSVTAISDGQRILVTRGMMHFAKNDNELAYVIGKEMAHNVLNHARTLQTTEANRKIIDNLIRITPGPAITARPAKPMTRQFDLDSDTLGLAMALRAGYEIDAAPAFWGNLARNYPSSNPASYTAAHPSSRARLEQMPKSVTRIKSAEKRRNALAGQH